MDIIHLLPDSVANQIAAGEVIQRPASCLKELVENSLDAGATHIQVIVVDAGRTLLQVIDDGKGMSETDARMAFERHATSKIAQASDIFSLRTMGFRGEALASICAVAHTEVQTRRPEDEMGTFLEIAGSQVIRQEPCQCPVGTNFRIKDLFYNVPARRKFLKTDQTELRNLLTEFYHIVLVYPHVQFTFVSNDEILMELPITTQKQRIEAVFGKSNSKLYTGQLLEMGSDTELVSIHGFIGKPENASKTPQQYFFVNGRYMRHPYFHKAVLNAYSGLLTADHNPSYFIYFDIAPETIDVNIHPTKTEIKFADEQAIFQILMATIREALGKFNITPSLDFTPSSVEMPILDKDASSHIRTPQMQMDSSYNPFKRSSEQAQNWQKLYEPLIPSKPQHSDMNLPSTDSIDENPLLFDKGHEDLSSLQQLGNKYILFPVESGLMFIHPHRAHVCVLYDAILRQIYEKQCLRQTLLFPEVISLTPDQMHLIQSIQDDLLLIGFEVEQFSPSAYSILSIPAVLQAESGEKTLQHILETIQESGTSAKEQWQQKMALTLAKNAAISAGKHLSTAEMQDLIEKLHALSMPRFTPDGQTVYYILSQEEIDKKF